MNQVRAPSGTPVTDVSGITHSVPTVRPFTWLPIPAYIALIAILSAAMSRSLAASLVFDPPVLMLVFNTVFLFGVSFAVCTVAMRAYLASGSSNILLLGCGVLALGSAALAGGWVRPLGGTANASVTIHNLGVLLASVLYAMSALLTLLKVEQEKILETRRQKLFIAFAGTLILLFIIIAVTLRGIVPLFWVAGVGSTSIKQAVLGTAVALFALTSTYTMILYFRTRGYFLYWYSLALALTAIGLIGITVMKAVGDPIGWAGRTAQYVGGVYFLMAALSALRDAKKQGVTLETAVDRFYRQSEVHYQDLVDTVSDAIISIDDRKRVLLWNQGAEKMFGYAPNEAAGCPVADLVMPEGFVERLNEELQALEGEIRNPFAAKGLEIEMRRKDGTTFPSETALSMRRIGSSWITTLVVRDFTGRKLNEERIARLTKLYSVLSRVSEMIVRTHDEGQLYAEVCRIVAEEGGFPLVWVGQVKDLQVMPTAWHGPEADYLKEIRVETEGELGHGPTGTCIREDRPVINDDFDINLSTAPWRKPAMSRGFRASAAFPLHRQGRVVGSLTIYAPEPGTFDAEHVKLLESLCADISYALDAIQHEKLRIQAEQTLRVSETRFKLLSETAEKLLVTDNPQEIVNELCRDVMGHLDCEAFFNFLVDEVTGRLHLNACAGIPEEEARKIDWLDYGVAVCGCVAQEGHPIVAGDILNTFDTRTELVKSYGIQAYACHPLVAQGRLIGILSFGTKTRSNFSPEDLALMKTVTDEVAMAMERMRLI
jgi:PAS domain S-box-containing protein